MQPTAPRISVEVDRIVQSDWDRLLPEFRDATIYQTWAYGAVRWGKTSLSRVVLRRGDDVVGLAQCAIRCLPLLGCGIAYVPWGPLWRRDDADPDAFRQLVRALREEYAVRRGLLLRIAPPETLDESNPIPAILSEEGYRRTADFYRTLLIDLSQPMENIRSQMSKRWRRALKKAEQLGLQIEEGTGDDLYGVFKTLYHDMVRRKGFVPGVDIDEFEQIQRALPESMKMHILLCRQEGKPTATLMASRLGDAGVGLLGATATEGLSSGSFHLLNLRMMEWLKASGARFYDFGGYDPTRNQGTATFKDGLPGRDISFVGRYETCARRTSAVIVHAGERLRQFTRKARQRTEARQNRPSDPSAASDSPDTGE